MTVDSEAGNPSPPIRVRRYHEVDGYIVDLDAMKAQNLTRYCVPSVQNLAVFANDGLVEITGKWEVEVVNVVLIHEFLMLADAKCRKCLHFADVETARYVSRIFTGGCNSDTNRRWRGLVASGIKEFDYVIE
jgi:hypothetical protein